MINSRSPYHIEYENIVATTTLATTTTTVAPISTTTTSLVYESCTVTNLSSTESLNFSYADQTSSIEAVDLAPLSSVNICMYNPEFFFSRAFGSTIFTFAKNGVACTP